MFIQRKTSAHERYTNNEPFIKLENGALITDSEIEGNVTIDKYSCVNRCTIMRYFGLGCFSYVANSHIGRYCTFGARASVGTFSHPTNWLSIHEFQYRDTSKIYGESLLTNGINIAPKNPVLTIGNDVWIGDNASVKYGLTIGSGAIIGLGAVITKDVPPYAIMGGNPARILRFRFNETIIEKLLALEWWSLDINDLAHIKFSDIHSAIDEIGKIKSNI